MLRRCLFFFFNDTATTEIYTLSLHDGSSDLTTSWFLAITPPPSAMPSSPAEILPQDRKSTRLNSSHQIISYAVFCLKKKKGTPSARGRQNLAYPAATGSLRRLSVPSN